MKRSAAEHAQRFFDHGDPLPDYLILGKACSNPKHGNGSRSVRYAKGNSCVYCRAEQYKRERHCQPLTNSKTTDLLIKTAQLGW